MVGTACYIAWRIYEAVTDPYGYGKDFRGLGKRSGIVLSTFADLLIVYSAIKVLLEIGDIQQSGEPHEERAFVSKVLNESWGASAVTAMGVVVLVAAVVQLVYGVTRGYKERLDIDNYSKAGKAIIHFLAWVGFCSRGIIVGITGFFLVKAAFTRDSENVVNTDKAFDFIGDEIGHLYFILVALGTVCYGIFMIIHGLAYDHDKD
jgi:NADH:ubiquinone oxidoreductase subunit 6 (subunit J)